MVTPLAGRLKPPTWGEAKPGARILVIESDETRCSALCSALRSSTGATVESMSSPPTEDRAWDLVTLDAQTVSAEQTDAVFDRFRTQHAHGKLIVRVPSSERHDVMRWFERGAQHLICRDEPHAEADVISAARKLLWGGASGPECYLREGAQTWSLSLVHSRDKALAFQLCRDLGPQLGLGKRKREALETIAEEFITNALYNAPVDETGTRRFAHLNRKAEVSLDTGHVIRVVLASDGDRVAISVTDPFGSLRADTVPSYLSKCFQRGEDQVNSKAGGAGLGLYFVYQSVSHLAVNIVPGRSTEMLGFIDLAATAGAIQRRAHSFGLFVSP